MALEIATLEDLKKFEERILVKLDELKLTNTDTTQKRWLQSADMKELLSISHGKLQQMRDLNQVKFVKVGGIIFYDRLEIDRILTKGMQSK